MFVIMIDAGDINDVVQRNRLCGNGGYGERQFDGGKGRYR